MEAGMDFHGAVYRVKRRFRPVSEPQGEPLFEGKPFSAPEYDMAIGYCGETEIKLITVGKVDNLYGRYLAQNPVGSLQHIGLFPESGRLGGGIQGQGFPAHPERPCEREAEHRRRFACTNRPATGLGCIVEGAELRLGRPPAVAPSASAWASSPVTPCVCGWKFLAGPRRSCRW